MKKPFTNHEHLGAGLLLSAIDRDMHVIANAIGDAYGKAEFNKAVAVIKALSKLKSALERQISAEHPASINEVEGVAITRVYTGWSGSEYIDRPRTSERQHMRDVAQVALAERAKQILDRD